MTGFHKAERRKAKMRLALAGASGSGKTASSLLIAYGLCGDWGKIGLIDTENRSGELYVGATIGGTEIGVYQALTLNAPFLAAKYTSAIAAAEEAGLEVVVIDSLSHAWDGEGGLLEKQGRLTDQLKNSYTAWRHITPEHNKLVEKMLQSPIHVIATMRSKTEYVLEEDDRGKKVPKKIGMAPIQRPGMEYEFTVFMDIDHTHAASASKDRTNTLDGQFFMPSVKTGQMLRAWLDSGVDAPAPEQSPVAAPPPAVTTGNGEAKATAKQISDFWAGVKAAGKTPVDVSSVTGGVDLRTVTTAQLADFLGQLKGVA